MTDISFVVTDVPLPSDRDAVLAPLLAHIKVQVGESNHAPLAILLRSDNSEAIEGGLWGRSGFGWLFVELLSVPEALRGLGIGTMLMQRAEAIARERGCIGVWLDTFSFQAPDFYQKLGYTVFGTIESYPQGHSRFFLQKRL